MASECMRRWANDGDRSMAHRGAQRTDMSKYFIRRDECGHRTLFPGVEAHTMAGEHMLLSLVELAPHSVVEMHSHPHEQLGMLLEGEVTFTVGDQQQLLRPGDMWRIPGGVSHALVTGADQALALDVFHPVREDYRDP